MHAPGQSGYGQTLDLGHAAAVAVVVVAVVQNDFGQYAKGIHVVHLAVIDAVVVGVVIIVLGREAHGRKNQIILETRKGLGQEAEHCRDGCGGGGSIGLLHNSTSVYTSRQQLPKR